ncbi:hypothetical protein TNCV_2112931 [Trichonephila clavipes]|nr:hypothetical protein TNCV_2112931 [Trichonephila clavipes]
MSSSLTIQQTSVTCRNSVPPSGVGREGISQAFGNWRKVEYWDTPPPESHRGLPCHEFEPSTTKEAPCRAAMHVKSIES